MASTQEAGLKVAASCKAGGWAIRQLYAGASCQRYRRRQAGVPEGCGWRQAGGRCALGVMYVCQFHVVFLAGNGMYVCLAGGKCMFGKVCGKYVCLVRWCLVRGVMW